MTVLLVLATFAVFLTIDYLYGRRRVAQPAAETAHERAQVPRPYPPLVAGFQVPDNVRYHLGHTWALQESPQFVRVGLDGFAARLLGQVNGIELPQRGQWIRQGQRLLTIRRGAAKTEVVSPIEGVITDINEAAAKDFEAARRDPYGEGWLVTVNSPDAKTNFRNLLGGALARKWMEEAAARLSQRTTTLAWAVAQDGGWALDDLTKGLPDQAWAELTQEFFLGGVLR